MTMSGCPTNSSQFDHLFICPSSLYGRGGESGLCSSRTTATEVEGQNVINESALLESKSLRSSVLDRTDVLDRVKALSLLPDGMHVTTAMVAAYFEVAVKSLESVVEVHREELELSGYQVLTGTRLTLFKRASGIQSRSRALALFSRRTVLNVAMLLRDSEIARQVRAYLLDMEYLARTQPVDNPARVVGRDELEAWTAGVRLKALH
jgi:restriction system protein